MSDRELRAATERLREHRRVVAAMEHPRNSPYTYVEVSTGAAGFVPEAEQKDMATVVSAYLAEHPADDDAPVDEVWLQSIGLMPNRGTLTFDIGSLSLELSAESFGEPPNVEAVFDGIVPHVNTRGHVRRLLVALGMARGG